MPGAIVLTTVCRFYKKLLKLKLVISIPLYFIMFCVQSIIATAPQNGDYLEELSL